MYNGPQIRPSWRSNYASWWREIIWCRIMLLQPSADVKTHWQSWHLLLWQVWGFTFMSCMRYKVTTTSKAHDALGLSVNFCWDSSLCQNTRVMFNSGLLVAYAHTSRLKKKKRGRMYPCRRRRSCYSIFISFNPKTEFGQKCLNPAPFNDLSAYSLYGGCGVRMQDTDTFSLLCTHETATNFKTTNNFEVVYSH